MRRGRDEDDARADQRPAADDTPARLRLHEGAVPRRSDRFSIGDHAARVRHWPTPPAEEPPFWTTAIPEVGGSGVFWIAYEDQLGLYDPRRSG
jgi:hypothetical protein